MTFLSADTRRSPTALPPMPLSLSPRSPEPTGPSQAAQQAALTRAFEAARDPLGIVDPVPWHYYVLGPETVSALAWRYAHHLEAEVGPEGARAAYEQWRTVPGWIVVTCTRFADAATMERAVEDCLTSVQRASLSLWSDNVPTNWVTDLITEEDGVHGLVEIDEAAEQILGVLWYGHPERG